MAIYFRGDPEPIKRIRRCVNKPGWVNVWMTDDVLASETPFLVQLARLIADGGPDEIDRECDKVRS